jgi:hypothetical protein
MKLLHYVNGDPVNLSDPSGHRYTIGCEGDQPVPRVRLTVRSALRIQCSSSATRQEARNATLFAGSSWLKLEQTPLQPMRLMSKGRLPCATLRLRTAARSVSAATCAAILG